MMNSDDVPVSPSFSLGLPLPLKTESTADKL